MNPRILNIFGLLSCALFLCANIVFDIWDTPGHPLDYRLFYIPLSIMIFALILLAKDYARKAGGGIYIFWWGFSWLSVGQVVKFIIFNPYIQMVSDYLFLSLVIIGAIIKLWKLKHKK